MSRLFAPPPSTCFDCGVEGLVAVSDGWQTNFRCPSCGACWHYELGWIAKVDPSTCPGCRDREACLGLQRVLRQATS